MNLLQNPYIPFRLLVIVVFCLTLFQANIALCHKENPGNTKYGFAINQSCFANRYYINDNSPLLLNKYTFTPGDTIEYNGSPVICPGGKLFLYTSFNSNNSFTWYKDQSPVATTATYEATTPGNYTVIVKSNGFTYSFNTLTVTSGVDPSASFTFQPGVECAQTDVAFTNTSTGEGLTYKWRFGDPNSTSSYNKSAEKNPSHKFVGNAGDSTQTYTVSLTVTTSAGCSSIYTKNITLNQSPNTDLGGTGATTFNGKAYFEQCTNAMSVFTFTNQSTTRNVSYNFYWGDGSRETTVTNFQSIAHPYRVGSYTLFYTVTGANGCSITKKYRIFVGTNPTIGFANKGSISTCTGVPVRFDINGSKNNTPGTIYTVTYGDSTVNTYTSPPDTLMHAFLTNSGNKVSTVNGKTFKNSFYAIIEASNPCGTMTDTIAPIYVSDSPKSSFINTLSDTTCVNTNLDFKNINLSGYTASPQGFYLNKFVWHISPATGYEADISNTGDDKSTDVSAWVSGTPDLPVKFIQPGTYSITLKTGSSCGTDSITKIICVSAVPVASFTVDNGEGCSPLIVKTNNTSDSPVCGNNSFEWNISYSNNGCIYESSKMSFINGTTPTSVNPQFQFDNPGLYQISLISHGPGQSCNSAVFSTTISVKAKPVVSIETPDTVYKDQAFKPAAIIQSCESGDLSYLWTFEGADRSASLALDPDLISYKDVGQHQISFAVTNNCGTTTVTKYVEVVSRFLNIPNTFTPNDDGINDTWNITGINNDPAALVRVFNRYGSLIFENRGYSKPWDGSFAGKKLPAGVYYYVINLPAKKQILKGWLSLIY